MVDFNLESTGKEVVAAFASKASGATFLITGPSEGGLGAETAITLASVKPSHLILAGRNEVKIAPVLDRIRSVDPAITLTFLPLDLCSNDSVRRAAMIVNNSVAGIDLLINNAGIAGQKRYIQSVNGIKAHFAANYLGHFLFTNLIIDKLVAAKGTIINMTSMAYTLAEVDTEDVNFDNGRNYNGWFAYARSKTANIMFSFALGDRLREKVAVFAVDPGMTHDTNLLANSEVDDAWMAEGLKLAVERNGGKARKYRNHR